MSKYYRQAGFSLIELCVTVAIAALIMTVGVPGFQSMSNENHASSHLDELNNAIRLARHLSVEHHRSAKVCARTFDSDPTAKPSCSSAHNDWVNGWAVMLEDDPSNAVCTDGWCDIMTSHHENDETNWAVVKSNGTDVLPEIKFRSTGTLHPDSSTSVSVTIELNGCSKITQISLTGQLDYSSFGCDPTPS